MSATLILEDFARTGPVQQALTGPTSDADGDETTGDPGHLAAYEQGYKAGWDDAVRAEAEDQTRIGAEFAQTLQDVTFTFHEARAQVVQSMEPLLSQIVDSFLPGLMSGALSATVLEELQPFLADAAGAAVELVLAPQSRAAVETHLGDTMPPGVRIVEEPSLAEGQAYIRAGRAARHVDMAEALGRMQGAVQGFFTQPEGLQKHG